MTCPKCGKDLYEQNRNETTGGTFISIRCTKCNFYDYKIIPVNLSGTTTVSTIDYNLNITKTR